MEKKNDLSFNEFSALSKEEWKEKVLKDLKGKDYESIVWKTENGFDLEPYLSAEEVDLSEGLPAEFPYERGGDTRNREWQICQEIFDLNFKAANKTLSPIDLAPFGVIILGSLGITNLFLSSLRYIVYKNYRSHFTLSWFLILLIVL